MPVTSGRSASARTTRSSTARPSGRSGAGTPARTRSALRAKGDSKRSSRSRSTSADSLPRIRAETSSRSSTPGASGRRAAAATSHARAIAAPSPRRTDAAHRPMVVQRGDFCPRMVHARGGCWPSFSPRASPRRRRPPPRRRRRSPAGTQAHAAFDSAAARREYERALALEPASVEARARRAHVLNDLGEEAAAARREAEAKALFEEALADRREPAARRPRPAGGPLRPRRHARQPDALPVRPREGGRRAADRRGGEARGRARPLPRSRLHRPRDHLPRAVVARRLRARHRPGGARRACRRGRSTTPRGCCGRRWLSIPTTRSTATSSLSPWRSRAGRGRGGPARASPGAARSRGEGPAQPRGRLARLGGCGAVDS